MACFVVLGAGRSVYGLGLYPSRAAYERFCVPDRMVITGPTSFRAWLKLPSTRSRSCPLQLHALLWTEHQLPAANKRAYPLAMKHLIDGDFARPSKKGN